MVGLCLCFAGETLIVTKSGTRRIDSLKPNEEILTLGRNKPKWSRFLSYLHREDERVATFLVFTFSNGVKLKVTEEHLLYVQDDNGKRIPIMAGNVSKGARMIFVLEMGEVSLVTVEKIESEQGTGIYAPLTDNGDFLANGILVTCYADTENFKVTNKAFSLLRAWYRMRKPTKETNGIHGYALALIKARNILPVPLRTYLSL